MANVKYIGQPAGKLVLADGLELPKPAELDGETYDALLPHHPGLAKYYELVEAPKRNKTKKDEADEE